MPSNRTHLPTINTTSSGASSSNLDTRRRSGNAYPVTPAYATTTAAYYEDASYQPLNKDYFAQPLDQQTEAQGSAQQEQVSPRSSMQVAYGGLTYDEDSQRVRRVSEAPSSGHESTSSMGQTSEESYTQAYMQQETHRAIEALLYTQRQSQGESSRHRSQYSIGGSQPQPIPQSVRPGSSRSGAHPSPSSSYTRRHQSPSSVIDSPSSPPNPFMLPDPAPAPAFAFDPDYVIAMHDFAPMAPNATCLSFRAGEVIHVLNRDETGWWDGELDGRRGWFPSNYVTTGSAAFQLGMGVVLSGGIPVVTDAVDSATAAVDPEEVAVDPRRGSSSPSRRESSGRSRRPKSTSETGHEYATTERASSSRGARSSPSHSGKKSRHSRVRSQSKEEGPKSLAFGESIM